MLENELFYRILALTVLAVFYGIYFIKMAAQAKQGIRTHQIGRRREKGLHTVETLMSIATLGVVIVQLAAIVSGHSHMPPVGRLAGFAVGIAGDAVFLASVLCMKDSWRAGIPESDKTKLVVGGIYSVSRNPAFLGFDMMYLGVAMLYLNIPVVLFSLFAQIMLHLQILQEEKYMAASFGSEYVSYKQKVLRYLGRRG